MHLALLTAQLNAGLGDQRTLQNCYAGGGYHSVAKRRGILDSASTPRPLQTFGFITPAIGFEQARAANTILTAWSMTESSGNGR